MNIDQPAMKHAMRSRQGVALTEAVNYLATKHVDIFQQKQVNGYIVSLASEEAEGMYQMTSGKLAWQTPKKDQNQHIELVVQDADDLRFVPYIEARVTVYNEAKKVVAETKLPYLWHPVASHYGADVSLPKNQKFSYKIEFPAPTFGRHDELIGKRLDKAVDVTFDDIKPELERELHGSE